MLLKNKILFGIAILLFYFGDLITTYHGLANGFSEANIFLANLDFYMIVMIKTVYFFLAYMLISHFEKHHYYTEIGVITGAIISAGLITVFNNIGVYS